jgi:hypothetical protein
VELWLTNLLDTLKAEEKAAKEFKEHSSGLTLISNQERFAQFGTSCDVLVNPRKEFVCYSRSEM